MEVSLDLLLQTGQRGLGPEQLGLHVHSPLLEIGIVVDAYDGVVISISLPGSLLPAP
jgi:hypothetical protein